MNWRWLETKDLYDGSQLVSLRGYLNHQMLGDSVYAWAGPCDVNLDHMVDGEDLLQNAAICGERMVHFVIELFESTLFAAVGVQRVFAAIVRDQILAQANERDLAFSLRRDGDDLWSGDRKLSISIATQSPVSSLIHFAVNITNAGTPVKTLSLEDLGIADPRIFAEGCMKTLVTEVTSIRQATRKVRWVK